MRWEFAILGIVLLFSAGCISGNQNTVHATSADSGGSSEFETIVVEGANQHVNVSSNKSLILVVSGSYNTVYVDDETELSEVIMSGSGNLVYLASSHSPKMKRSGIQNLILRYT